MGDFSLGLEDYLNMLKGKGYSVKPSGLGDDLMLIKASAPRPGDIDDSQFDYGFILRRGHLAGVKAEWPGVNGLEMAGYAEPGIIKIAVVTGEQTVMYDAERHAQYRLYELTVCAWGGRNEKGEEIPPGSDYRLIEELIKSPVIAFPRPRDIKAGFVWNGKHLELRWFDYGLQETNHAVSFNVRERTVNHIFSDGESFSITPLRQYSIKGVTVFGNYQFSLVQSDKGAYVLSVNENNSTIELPNALTGDERTAIDALLKTNSDWLELPRRVPVISYASSL